jgi:hypothetical protein
LFKPLDRNIYSAPTEISKVEKQNIKYVKRAIRQRFLSPKIIKAITSNDSNYIQSEIGVENLSNLSSWNWKVQETSLLK